MSAPTSRFDSVRKHLDVVEDSWKADHHAAMRCRDLEDYLAQATMVFHLIDRIGRTRREHVFRGLEEPNPQLDEAEKDLHARWLNFATVLEQPLRQFEQAFAQVEGAAEFRECQVTARRALENWRPAVLARAVASRIHDMSDEDADQIHDLLQQSALAGTQGPKS
jgi:hypothetical protein